MSETKTTQNIPMYWELINDVDKASYLNIQKMLSSSECKHRRHHSKAINNDILSTIKAFITKNDADDWKRSIVCGIGWIDNAIIINTRQLRILTSKCKSSINAMLQGIGYMTVPTSNDFSCNVTISSYYPIIKDNFAELRKWTIRCPKPLGTIFLAASTPITNVGVPIISEQITKEQVRTQ